MGSQGIISGLDTPLGNRLMRTFIAFVGPAMAGLLVVCEGIQLEEEGRAYMATSGMAAPDVPSDLFPFFYVVLAWLLLGGAMFLVAKLLKGKGTLVDSLGISGSAFGLIAAIEMVRLLVVLWGANEWIGTALFCVGVLVVSGWMGRAWGKAHLLTEKQTRMAALVCVIVPLAGAGVTVLPPLLQLWNITEKLL